MLTPERRLAILDYLKENHSATVEELSRKFFISATSIRRDLTELERSGYVKKTYGGAIIAQGHNDLIALEARQHIEKTEKLVIAQKAASLIENGDVIFLDSSSTALALVPHLERFTSLTVITHGLKVATSLTQYPHIRVYFAGGLVTPAIYSCSGVLTGDILKGMHADKCFASPRAVDLQFGVFCANEEEASVRRIMLERSDRFILLCSGKKLGHCSSFRLCSLQEIDTIVCEETPSAVWQESFRENAVTCL